MAKRRGPRAQAHNLSHTPYTRFSNRPRRKGHQSTPSELPPCEGPKLNLFEHHKSRIQWLERLDNKDKDVTSSEGYVFRARIHGHEYAIKVFKFYDPMSSKSYWGPALGEDTSLDTASYYTDPFYAECRAYGRIHAAKGTQLKAIAVPCHGYLFLRRKDKEELERRGIDFGHVNSAYQRSTIGGLRVRAIVKDIASSNSGVTSTTVRRILRRMVSMNKEGIYNMDIRIDNFRDGKLVDFGLSWTEPHALLDLYPPDAALERKTADRVFFEQMVKEEEIKTSGKLGRVVKALHDMRLRSQAVQ